MKKLFSKKGLVALLGTSMFVLAMACTTANAAENPQTPTPGTGADNPADGPGYPTEVIEAPIEGLEVIVDPNDPNKFIVRVTSGLPGGCAKFESYGFSKQGRLFTISVQNRVPAEDAEVACTMIYGYHETEIPLGAIGEDLEACKTYTVRAGEREETFQAAGPAVTCPAPDTDNGYGLIADAEALILTLKSMGIDAVIVSEDKAVELFGRKSTVLEINGEYVHVFEFSPGNSAHDVADGVSDDGTTFDNGDGSMVSVRWIAPVRFYLFGNSIVHYLGTNQAVIDALNRVGTQFAGEGYEPLPDGEMETVQEPAPVVSVGEVQFLESFPVQYALNVRTAQPNGCARQGDHSVELDENTIHVTVNNIVPAHPEVVLCTMIYGETDVYVNLGSGLESGEEYTVIVNGDESNAVKFVAQ